MAELMKDAYPDIFRELEHDQSKHGIDDINSLLKSYRGILSWVHVTDTGTHRWEADANARTTRGVGCPYCSGRLAIPGYTDLATVNPAAAKLWDYSKNSKNPNQYKPGSKEIVSWKCEKGHEWSKAVNSQNRRKTQDCDYCKDITYLYPEIAAQWHPTKNNQPTPYGIAPYTKDEYWWKCKEGHEIFTSPANKHNKENPQKPVCSICSGKEILPGYNDLKTLEPQIAAQWHPTKNGNKKPENYSRASGAKIWWLGDCQHEWPAVISSRTTGNKTGCPQCGHKEWLKLNNTAIKTNNLLQTHPEIAAQWHPTKNGSITPEMRTAGSNFKAVWVCEKKHEWVTGINKRAKGSKCHYCTNQKVLTGYNDLATTNPELMKEWDWNKNQNINPQKIIAGSNINKYWWKCDKNHSWCATSNDRVTGYGCPQCASARYVSVPEKELAEYLKKQLPHLTIDTSRYGIIKGELDIYIPEKNVAIEFNGLYWHSEAAGKNKWYHHNKYKNCQEKGIQLIQIWEDDWNKRKEFIKLALLHKLQEADSTLRIGARKLKAIQINYQTTDEFLNTNHIQGSVQGSRYYALSTNDSIILEGDIKAILVVKKVGNKGHEGEWRIERYATSCPVPGGFTKLLKHAEKELAKAEEKLTTWVTFSDNCISDGGLYSNNGFAKDSELEPDYMYKVGSQRIHKFNYRLKRFREDPALKWKENLSESQLAKLNNLHRIWDAGKIRWIKEV